MGLSLLEFDHDKMVLLKVSENACLWTEIDIKTEQGIGIEFILEIPTRCEAETSIYIKKSF